MTDLTPVQNACLEAANDGAVSAADVVAHVKRSLAEGDLATISHPITKLQASRALRQLCDWGILRREPRSSAGWGRGWYPVFYSLAKGAA